MKISIVLTYLFIYFIINNAKSWVWSKEYYSRNKGDYIQNTKVVSIYLTMGYGLNYKLSLFLLEWGLVFIESVKKLGISSEM